MQQMKAVKLIRNNIYPTYQLHATMNADVNPKAGLIKAVRVTLGWLADRMSEATPDEITAAVSEGASEESILFSKHISAGYLIDIVYLEDEELWSLHVSEPDLGSEPGEAQQTRAAVPGRIIETEVEYHIINNTLECGFRTMVSDPEGSEKAEVYRLAIIKKLAFDPDFGLKQIVALTKEPVVLDSKKAVDGLYELWNNKKNQLPLVVFTEHIKEQVPELPAKEFPPPQAVAASSMTSNFQRSFMPEGLPKAKPAQPVCEQLYDVGRFAESCVGYGRTYELKADVQEHFRTKFHVSFLSGAILLLHPIAFEDRKIEKYDYKTNEAKRNEQAEMLRKLIHEYPLEKRVDFGNIIFLSEAREKLQETISSLKAEVGKINEERKSEAGQFQNQLTENSARIQDSLDEKDRKIASVKAENTKLTEENKRLQTEIQETEKSSQLKLREKDQIIEYLRRKMQQPKNQSEIAEWAEPLFGDRLIFHDRAKRLLKEKQQPNLDIGILCDAIEYLASEYWEAQYAGLSEEDAKQRCSDKYGRPFEIKPTSETTISAYPSNYKIKYFIGAKGKPVESALNFHLCYGNKTEFLIRIYFLRDDEKKKIVIGSLPAHLSTLTYQ